MGYLEDGKWNTQDFNNNDSSGKFVRSESAFRHQIHSDKNSKFSAEKNRYHLFVASACPWAHRTLIFRALKNLESIISVSYVDPQMLENSWVFTDKAANNPVRNIKCLHELYALADKDYSGRVSVPVLWDKKYSTIVNNESSEIIRIFNTAFNHITGNNDDYYPSELRQEIDKINDRIYEKVNNGVYRAGFAASQEAYEQAFDGIFDTLDFLEQRLNTQRYLTGKQITETDWRLFTTLIRFDAVYFSHFKANKRRITDYHNLSNYLRELYQYPKIAETVNIREIKTHYYFSQIKVNPTQIVPKGPELNFSQPHDRDKF